MILRIYRARVHPGLEAEFERLFRADAVPLMQRQAGFVSFQIGRALNGEPELIVISQWRDLESLQAYAGEGWQTPPVLHPGAGVLERALLEHFILPDV